MAKGAMAKQLVENKIAQVFGNDFIGNIDKKLYVWADDGGERVQIAISMTCPKVFVGDAVDTGALDFEAMTPIKAPEPAPAEITKEETDNLTALMERLGL